MHDDVEVLLGHKYDIFALSPQIMERGRERGKKEKISLPEKNINVHRGK
jgi:hypothetical protein